MPPNANENASKHGENVKSKRVGDFKRLLLILHLIPLLLLGV